jgi:hypothetical protein
MQQQNKIRLIMLGCSSHRVTDVTITCGVVQSACEIFVGNAAREPPSSGGCIKQGHQEQLPGNSVQPSCFPEAPVRNQTVQCTSEQLHSRRGHFHMLLAMRPVVLHCSGNHTRPWFCRNLQTFSARGVCLLCTLLLFQEPQSGREWQWNRPAQPAHLRSLWCDPPALNVHS